MSSLIIYYLISKPSTVFFICNFKYWPPIKPSHTLFRKTFLLCTVIEWNKLDSNNRSSPSQKKSQILKSQI